ncbi:CGNR zinc finger domain-containing protein [Actinoplanes solisilvae]|uniref:CGNR zinc finger domain-containing protein n=1 Tax=Actinoplanes solisilvae TaxID=2486853 RepID=UPI001F0CC310|nr:CGNR zinc finger domain-containing protein [Actinoplanes solisilvae]
MDENLLLDLLNTTPVVDGSPTDELADAAAGLRWLTAHDQPATADEWRALIAARSVLQEIVRSVDPTAADPAAPSQEAGVASQEAGVASQEAGVASQEAGVASLSAFLDGVAYRPEPGPDGLDWVLDLPEGRSAAARAVLAWDALRTKRPGRLRACANPACRLFLVDHSKANSARWCSMAACGNRMKARRHYQRNRGGSE